MFKLEDFSTRGLIENAPYYVQSTKREIRIQGSEFLKRHNIRNYLELQEILNRDANDATEAVISYLKEQLRAVNFKIKDLNDKIAAENIEPCNKNVNYGDVVFWTARKLIDAGVDGVTDEILRATDQANLGDILLCSVNNPLTGNGPSQKRSELQRYSIADLKALLTTLDPITLKCAFLAPRAIGTQTGMDVISALEKYHKQLSRQAKAQPTPVSSANLLEEQLEEKQAAIAPHFQTVASELMSMTNLLIWGPMTEAKKQRLENACYDENSELRRTIIRLLALNTTYDKALNFDKKDTRTEVLTRMLKKKIQITGMRSK